MVDLVAVMSRVTAGGAGCRRHSVVGETRLGSVQWQVQAGGCAQFSAVPVGLTAGA